MTTAPTSLHRVLKTHHLFALSFGTIVGTGWITGLGLWLGLAGSFGSVLGFALGGCVMTLIGLCYARLAVRYPKAGGEVLYSYEMWGAASAFATGWCMVLIYVTAISFQTVALAWMLDALLEPRWRGVELYRILGEPIHATATFASLGLGCCIAWLNHRGVAAIAQFQSWLTFSKIAISLGFFACAWTVGDVRNLQPHWSAHSGEFSLAGLWAVFATAPFFLAGFDVIPLAMGERSASTSQRAVYIAIVGSLAAAVAYYALVILSGAMLLPRDALLAANLPAIAAFEQAFGSATLARVVLIAGLMGVLTCWNASVFAASRVLLTMSGARMLPGWLSHLHPRFGTPGRAAVFATVLGLTLLPFGKAIVLPIVNSSGSSLAIVALIVCGGLLRPRFARGSSVIVSATACLGASFILFIAFRDSWSAAAPGALPMEWLIAGLWAALGVTMWLATARQRDAISPEQRRSILFGAETQQ